MLHCSGSTCLWLRVSGRVHLGRGEGTSFLKKNSLTSYYWEKPFFFTGQKGSLNTRAEAMEPIGSETTNFLNFVAKEHHTFVILAFNFSYVPCYFLTRDWYYISKDWYNITYSFLHIGLVWNILRSEFTCLFAA